MRTTIILNDELGERLRNQARQEGMSFSAFMADAGLKALEKCESTHSVPFRLITFRGGGAVAGVDLDRTNELLTTEDRVLYGERSE